MELAVAVSVIIAIISVFTSCLIVKRVKKQISEMYDVLADIKNGNGNRRILSGIYHVSVNYHCCHFRSGFLSYH